MSDKFLKITMVILGISVIALGVTDVVFTIKGLMFPHSLLYLSLALTALNGMLLSKAAREKTDK